MADTIEFGCGCFMIDGKYERQCAEHRPKDHVGSPEGYAAVPIVHGIKHDPHCCASRGCHGVCSHLCETDLAATCCAAQK